MNLFKPPQGPPGDPRFQIFNITDADGASVPVPMSLVDFDREHAVNISINYGSQIGASLTMLIVMLVMSPSAKLRRAYTALQAAALAVNVVRMVLLSLFWPSEWMSMFALYTGDYRFVSRGEYALSVSMNVSSLLVTLLVEACLIMQAWTMVNLWHDLWKWAAAAASAAVSLTTVGFRFAFCVVQSQAVLNATSAVRTEWVAHVTIITGATSIFWYCALFNMQLIAHLVKNRSFLPTASGLSPMEALVFSNGILMAVPVVFAGLQWLNSAKFEAGSLMYTSVAVILPLGTLVAHRLTAMRSSNLSDGVGSAWNSKPSAIHSSITSSNPRSRLVTRVEAPMDGHSYEDLELNDHGHGAGKTGGVRVYRDVDQTVEHSPRQLS
ncbi:hypothetical protein VUR80DRAFT_2550 [Thermomyces stellatus]